MEFLRFGSSIPGGYWGCCACCIIQNFKVEPDAPASIQLVSGDGGGAVTRGRDALFAGPTYRDIFWQRIRSGTFDSRDMPNHAFFAIITQDQISGSIGKKWLEILREAGFEFVRTVCNSVYSGQELTAKDVKPAAGSGSSKNYIFGLFRNIGNGTIGDPFTPPKEWQALPKPNDDYAEAWEAANLSTVEFVNLANQQRSSQRAIWDKIGPPNFLTEAELVAKNVPVTLAGLRSSFPPQTKEQRTAAASNAIRAATALSKGPAADPFAPVPTKAKATSLAPMKVGTCSCGDPGCELG